MAFPPSKVIGCDFSGTVKTPNSSSFHEGDRVAGVIHGCKDSHTGGFAEFLTADPAMCFLVPPNVGLEEACTLGVGWVSATQALEQRLFKDEDKDGKGLEKDDAVRGDLLFLFSLEIMIMMMMQLLHLPQESSLTSRP